jgi:hypothetical protein
MGSMSFQYSIDTISVPFTFFTDESATSALKNEARTGHDLIAQFQSISIELDSERILGSLFFDNSMKSSCEYPHQQTIDTSLPISTNKVN